MKELKFKETTVLRSKRCHNTMTTVFVSQGHFFNPHSSRNMAGNECKSTSIFIKVTHEARKGGDRAPDWPFIIAIVQNSQFPQLIQ